MNVRTTLVPTVASASQASVEMVISVKILMNVEMVYTSAPFMQSVPILKVPMLVCAMLDTLETDLSAANRSGKEQRDRVLLIILPVVIEQFILTVYANVLMGT